jgi:hypothetical protein
MEGPEASGVLDDDASQTLGEDAKPGLKRAKMTNERIQLVANTLMLEGNMRQFGHILKSNAKGHFAQGSKKYFEAFANLLNSKDHPLLRGCFVGVEALQNWIKEVKNLAQTESKRRSSESEIGRRQSNDDIPPHIDACYQLMEMFYVHDANAQKNHVNRYNAKPEGMEHLELQGL